MFTTFYNETIRRTVIGFGSLFDDIFIQRKNSLELYRKTRPIILAKENL